MQTTQMMVMKMNVTVPVMVVEMATMMMVEMVEATVQMINVVP